jgi:heme ABC exporter ATP-binding subunit CcmA
MALIVLRGVTKRYGASVALRGIDLDVEAGEAVALFGHNGSGKTTLLKLVAGLLRPTAGSVTVDGSQPRAVRGRIGYVGHQPYLYPYLSVTENLAFYARLYDVPPARGAGLLAQVGMAAKADSLVHTLSRGETQRVSLARALLHDPDVLLADEPFSGLDQAAATAMPGLLRREGRTLLMASHEPAQAMAVCDRSVTLEHGRVLPAGEPEPGPAPAGGEAIGRGAAGSRP